MTTRIMTLFRPAPRLASIAPQILALLAIPVVEAGEVEVPQPIRDQGYRLVFQDEFNGDKGASPDPTKWGHMMEGKWRDLWYVKNTVRHDGGGNLRIEVRKNGDHYETGYIGTAGKFMAMHGYFEARIRLQSQGGYWSAFWLASPTMNQMVDDPVNAGVEIDVIEHIAYNGNKVHHTAHWSGYKEHHKAYSTPQVPFPGLTTGFHTFAVKWDEKGYVFFVDGKETGRWPASVPIARRPEYLLLTCESESWAGDITKAKLPDDIAVDYVRVWQTSVQIEAERQWKEKNNEAK